MTEISNVFIAFCVSCRTLQPPSRAPSVRSPSAAQLWVSAVTGQLIRGAPCLSEAVTGSCWVHDSVHAHPGLWMYLGGHAYRHWCMRRMFWHVCRNLVPLATGSSNFCTFSRGWIFMELPPPPSFFFTPKYIKQKIHSLCVWENKYEVSCQTVWFFFLFCFVFSYNTSSQKCQTII